MIRHDIPFAKIGHLHNPWNENISVKRSRDGQLLHPNIGQELCRLIEQGKENLTKHVWNELNHEFDFILFYLCYFMLFIFVVTTESMQLQIQSVPAEAQNSDSHQSLPSRDGESTWDSDIYYL
jgi:hypothetical protein